MKKRTKTYILLVAVLLIWGAIGFQIHSRMNPGIEQTVFEPIIPYTKEKVTKQNFYALQKEYRDPFLGGFPQKKKVIRKRISKKEPTVPFPNIIYNGIIAGNSSKSFIITINGQQEILKLGESKQQVKLISANEKKAIVRFQKVKKTFLLNNK